LRKSGSNVSCALAKMSRKDRETRKSRLTAAVSGRVREKTSQKGVGRHFENGNILATKNQMLTIAPDLSKKSKFWDSNQLLGGGGTGGLMRIRSKRL